MHITVLAAGAWGTAIAAAAAIQAAQPSDPSRSASPTQVTLWTHDEALAHTLRTTRTNARYLPDVALPPTLAISHAPLEEVAAGASAQDLLIIATPTAALRQMLSAIERSGTHAPVAWLCKGFEMPHTTANAAPIGLLPHEVCAAVAPRLRSAALSGPSFAREVALGQPTCLVAASADGALRQQLVAALHGGSLRVYGREDIVGVEVGGAVKNVLAIAAGLCDGLGLGLNARAALLTRGLAEMTRLGLALGAQMQTFMGLSGLGDLILTATGDLSRNRKVGLLLAQGLSTDDAVASLGHVAEGVYTARTVWQRAQALGVDMPITAAVVQVLSGQMLPAQALQTLLTRDAKDE